MAKASGQKLKLLYLRDYLLKNSDEAHPVTINDMIAYLAERGVSAERKSLYDDIASLQDYGLDIIKIKAKSTGYYVASRDFELPEVKLLIDAVQSSRFITTRKTDALIKKIEGLASSHEGRSLHHQVFIQNRVKSVNESVYYNVDLISEGIDRGVKLSFRYFEYGADKQRRYRRGGDQYVVSPEFLIWDDENYYLVACPDDTGDTRHYRVDKMEGIELLSDRAQPRKNDPAIYSNTLFSMFNGEKRNVRIRFSDELAGVVIDRFGSDVIFARYDDHSFTVNVDVADSPQFRAWIFGLGSGAEILAPEDVRQRMKAELESILERYK